MSSPAPISNTPVILALFDCAISAGFPSPAADHTQKRIDLTEQLIINQDATFHFRVSGESMRGAGIYDGDVILVDRSVEPTHGLIVVDGEFTVKRLYKRGKTIRLMSENEAFPPIELCDEQELVIWGVVTFSIRPHFKPARKRNAKASV
jgi:DNA polymerase V